MYSKVHSVTSLKELNRFCTVEVGLSSGIPLIKYLGRVSSELSRSKEKIPFIFSYLGRKLPSRKIRVNFSSDQIVSSSHLDLAVCTALYLAANNLEPKEKVWCIGEVDMDGKIGGRGSLARSIYSISNSTRDEDSILFIPRCDEELLSLYPDLKVKQVDNMKDIFDYFEGIECEQPRISKVNRAEMVKIDREVEVHEEYLGAAIASDQMNIYENKTEKPIVREKNLENLLESIHGDTGKRINSLLSKPGINFYKKGSYSNIVSSDSIKEIVWILENCGEEIKGRKALLHLDQREEEILHTKNFEDMYEFLSKDLIILIDATSCLCGENKCTCTTTELYRYRESLRKVAKWIPLLFYTDNEGTSGQYTKNTYTIDIKKLRVVEEMIADNDQTHLKYLLNKLIDQKKDLKKLQNKMIADRSMILESLS